MKGRLQAFFALIFLTGLQTTVPAQQQSPRLTLEDIFQNGTYQTKGYQAIKWLNEQAFTTLEAAPAGSGRDIISNDVSTGEKRVLVAARQLTPNGQSEPLKVADYIWSADKKKLLIFTNTRKVWRYHTRGDYWLLDLSNMKLSQLGKGIAEATMMFAKFSPDAQKVAFVSRNNIYVEDLLSGKIKQITKDGGDNIINGTFDWVYEEELDCRDGFRWSPDGQHIAYWQSNTEGTGSFYLINNVDSVYSKPILLPYPKVGTTNSAVKVGVIPVNGGETRWFNVPGDPRNHYLARMEFIPNSSEVMIQQLNRLQNTNRVWTGDIRTMSLTNILTDTDEAFLDIHDNIEWLEEDKYFTWTSEKDGWLHLYKVSRDGRQMDLITKGDFDVVQINSIDTEGGYVYYIASPHNYTQRYLYRSRLDGSGEAEQISPENQQGQHSYIISDRAKYAIHTFHNATTPNRISLIKLPEHQELKLLEDNAQLKVRFDALKLNSKAFIKVDIGEVVLDAWMIKPPAFDPGKKYPLLFYIYGEPAGSTVQDSWSGGDLWHQYLAQQGYVVVSIDNRGTRTPRGRDWRKSIYGQIGILAAKDQAAAALKILDEYSFLDRKRVGMWGWSGGGQMTLNCLFRYPEIYKTGIAVAFVSDQKLYDTIYQERYMGLPAENKEGYFDGSPINHAHKLEGNLMIIHGTADDNVHYQSFEMLVNQLIKHNKLFQMMSYPMRSHSINERENTSLHLRRTMANYWFSNL